jgi:hypothetical protein
MKEKTPKAELINPIKVDREAIDIIDEKFSVYCQENNLSGEAKVVFNFLKPYCTKIEPMDFAEYCIKCYGRQIPEIEISPIGFSFAQANYTIYLANFKK